MNNQYINQNTDMNNQQTDLNNRRTDMNNQYNDLNNQRANIDSRDSTMRAQNMGTKHTLMDNYPADMTGQSKHTNSHRTNTDKPFTDMSGQQPMNNQGTRMKDQLTNLGDQRHQTIGMDSNSQRMDGQHHNLSNQPIGMNQRSSHGLMDNQQINPLGQHDMMNTQQHANRNTTNDMMNTHHSNPNNHHDMTNTQHSNPINHDIVGSQNANPIKSQGIMNTQKSSTLNNDTMNVQPNNPNNHHDIMNTHHTSHVPVRDHSPTISGTNRSTGMDHLDHGMNVNKINQTDIGHGINTGNNSNNNQRMAADSKTGIHPTTVEDTNRSTNLTQTSNPVPGHHNNNTSISAKNHLNNKDGLSAISSTPSEYGSSDDNTSPRTSNTKRAPLTADKNAFIQSNDTKKHWQNNMSPADRSKELAKEMDSIIKDRRRSSDDHDKSLKIGEKKEFKLD
ncbi:hypothetical protein INT48_003656 [Thamnidium elegans]|uniref:Uncharacterized protein n=1 Tax=Thamnidium elegans TaxID=101142 RepID=A0A8H7SNU3_9FUNG|nr:hypothetical protein INT48_003656 [Thamnidium elegans]